MTKEEAKTIFIVDDDDSIRRLLHRTLKEAGFSVIAAKDGREAIEIIDRDSAPDMVLLDIMMPHVDGYGVLEQIKSTDQWSDVPVVMLTGKDSLEDIKQSFRAGVSDYIVKPFVPDELVEKLKAFI